MTSTKKITDFVSFNPKRTIKKGETKPFVEMAALPVDSRDISEIGSRTYKGGGSRFQDGDTLFARITPCLENGKTAKTSGLGDGVIAHGSTEFIVLAAMEPEYDEDYVYYLARMPEFRAYAQSRMEGTSGRQRVSWQSLAEFEFVFPDKEDRKEIGRILKSIDDKIQVNNQLNQTLEQIAQAIFKSWFVDFEPVKAKMAALEAGGTAEQAELAAMSAISAKDEADLKQLQSDQPEAYAELAQTAALFSSAMEDSEHGEMPNGWKYDPVINSAEYINGAAYKNMHFSNAPDAKPVIKIAELKNGITDKTKFTNTELGDKFKLNTRDILFSWSGSPETSIDTFIWTGGKAWLNQHIFKVVNSTEKERCFTYWLLKFLKPTFIEIAKNKQTTGLGHVTRKDMERLHYCKPNDEAMSLFFKFAGTILSKIENNLIENLNLAESRDELLPKLLSGDLSMPESEKTNEEALA